MYNNNSGDVARYKPMYPVAQLGFIFRRGYTYINKINLGGGHSPQTPPLVAPLDVPKHARRK